MKTFKEFVCELSHTNHLPIEKHHANIGTEEGINELNKNLSAVSGVDYVNPSEGMNKTKKVLSMYGVEIKTPELGTTEEGELNIPFSISNVYDELEGPENAHSHVLTFKYKLESGKYNISAKVLKNK